MSATAVLETIPAQFARAVAARANQVAVLLPGEDGAVRSISWGEFSEDARRFAAALSASGLTPGARVAHVSGNRYEWLVTDLALHIVRAVHVPIHVTQSGAQIAAQIEHSGARTVIVVDETVFAKFHDRVSPALDFVLYDPPSSNNAWVGLPTQRQRIDDASAKLGNELADRALEETETDDLATILYTSGTTGEPKGVMLSQRNLATNCVATAHVVDACADDVRLNFLPLSHIYARLCDLYCWVYMGQQLALARSRDTVFADCQAVRPHVLSGVPYFFEKMIQYLHETGKADEPGALVRLFGGRLRVCACGGAACPIHVQQFFTKQNVCLCPGYGLTESSPVISVAKPEGSPLGSVGPPVEDVEVRIAEDGEVLTRGPHVMLGYYKDEAATREAVRDGWLYTGDFGELDDDGNLTIRGRKKEVIVLATGKNVTPPHIEGLLTSSRLIEQAMVVGDDRKFLAALIYPDPEGLATEMARRGMALPPQREWPTAQSVQALLEEEIATRVATAADWEQVRAFTLLTKPFSIDGGELTPKLSLRRNVILSHFHDAIEAMYAK